MSSWVVAHGLAEFRRGRLNGIISAMASNSVKQDVRGNVSEMCL